MYAKGQHLKAVDLKLFEQVKAEVVSVSQLASAFGVLCLSCLSLLSLSLAAVTLAGSMNTPHHAA